MKPSAWYCPTCNKFDLRDSTENLAAPEHVSYHGIDIGSCKGTMIPLFALQNIPSREDLKHLKEIEAKHRTKGGARAKTTSSKDWIIAEALSKVIALVESML